MVFPYYREGISREAFVPDTTNANEIIEILGDESLLKEVDSGNVTIAMIRPLLDACTLEDWSDRQACEQIDYSISDLGVLSKFAVRFDDSTVNKFYAGTPKTTQLDMKPERYERFENRWDEFVDLMTAGPTTVLLLYSPDGDAVELWRKQVGHYDIVNKRDSNTIRGKFGLDNYNNLVHGSDSIESVKKELKIMQSLLRASDKNLAKTHSSIEKYREIGSSTLTLLHISNPDFVTAISDWTPSGETFYRELLVNTGREVNHYVEKACVKILPSETLREWLSRRRILQRAGVETPKLQAHDLVEIIEEYIPYSLSDAYNRLDLDNQIILKERFVETYKRILIAGFTPISFHDVRSRGDDVVVIDFGSDLGGQASQQSTTKEQAQIENEFYKLVN